MQLLDDPAIVEIYKVYVKDANDLRASRVGENGVRVTVVTLFLGAQAFISSSLLSDSKITDAEFKTWIPYLAIALVGYIATRFCANWRRLVKDLTGSINVKFTNLRKLEENSVVLNRAGARLFIDEYKSRHRDYVPPQLATPSAASEATPSAATEAVLHPALQVRRNHKRAGKPVRGAGLSAIDLSEFFLVIFRTTTVAAIVVKGAAVLIHFMLVSGIIQDAPHLIGH